MEIAVKHRNETHIILVPSLAISLREFKTQVAAVTGVPVDKQVLVGLYKARYSRRSDADEDRTLAELGILFRVGRRLQCDLIGSRIAPTPVVIDTPSPSITTAPSPTSPAVHMDVDKDEEFDEEPDDGVQIPRGFSRQLDQRLFGVPELSRGVFGPRLDGTGVFDSEEEIPEYFGMMQPPPFQKPQRDDITEILDELGSETQIDSISELISSSGVVQQSGRFNLTVRAARHDARIILVVVHNDRSEVSQSVMAQFFTSPFAIETLTKKFIVWHRPGPPRDPERGSRWLERASRVLLLNQLPFMCMCVTVGSQINVVDIVQGEFSVDDAVSKLINTLETWQDHMVQEQAKTAMVSEDEILRKVQDEEYAMALEQARTQEELEKKHLEEERLEQKRRKEVEERAVREAQEKERLREEHLESLKLSVGVEPEHGDPLASNLQIRTTDGSKVMRRFRKDVSLQIVLNFLELQGEAVGECVLVLSFPRRILEDNTATLEALGLHPSATLFLERK